MQEILVKTREKVGKGLNVLRRDGALPAVLYGEDIPSTPVSISRKDFEKALARAGETSLIAVKLDHGKTYNVLIHDVARDPLTLKPIHADFYAVNMDKPIEAKIPLNFVGESPAVKNESGILVKVLHELEIKALPKDLPHAIEVDLAPLQKLDDKIHVRDIKLPPGVEVKADSGEVVVLVEPPRAEAELEALVKPAEETAVAEVKTEREVKAETKEVSEEIEETKK